MCRDIAAIFADIDSFDPDRFVAHLTEDVIFRFANAEPTAGRSATRDAVMEFFTNIRGLSHSIVNTWEIGPTIIVQANVTYLRKDGSNITVPNADIIDYRGNLVCNWQIYIDIGPVLS